MQRKQWQAYSGRLLSLIESLLVCHEFCKLISAWCYLVSSSAGNNVHTWPTAPRFIALGWPRHCEGVCNAFLSDTDNWHLPKKWPLELRRLGKNIQIQLRKMYQSLWCFHTILFPWQRDLHECLVQLLLVWPSRRHSLRHFSPSSNLSCAKSYFQDHCISWTFGIYKSCKDCRKFTVLLPPWREENTFILKDLFLRRNNSYFYWVLEFSIFIVRRSLDT